MLVIACQILSYHLVLLYVCSDIKASHILVQVDGSVRLSGFRHCLSMTLHGQRRKSVHDFPDFYIHSLNWASHELLEQVFSLLCITHALVAMFVFGLPVAGFVHRLLFRSTPLQSRSIRAALASGRFLVHLQILFVSGLVHLSFTEGI